MSLEDSANNSSNKKRKNKKDSAAAAAATVAVDAESEAAPEDSEDVESSENHLSIACRERRERVRLLLLVSSKTALSDEQRRLLKDLNWEARRAAMIVCSGLLKASRPMFEALRKRQQEERQRQKELDSGDSRPKEVISRKATFEYTICCGAEDVWRIILSFL